MRRSTEFDTTVRHGVRVVQPDLVVHVRRDGGDTPHVGLIIPKSVGSAVERHRVARRLRHVARTMLGDLHEVDRVVIRALPSSRSAASAHLEEQLRHGLRHAVQSAGTDR